MLHQQLYCYRFFLSLYMNQVPEMLYLVHDLITLKFIWPFWPPLFGLCLIITQLQDKFRLRHDCFYISLLITQRPTYLHKGQWVIMMTRPILKISCFILFVYILYLQSKDLKMCTRLICHRRLHWYGVITQLDNQRSFVFLGIYIWIFIMLAHWNNSP